MLTCSTVGVASSTLGMEAVKIHKSYSSNHNLHFLLVTPELGHNTCFLAKHLDNVIFFNSNFEQTAWNHFKRSPKKSLKLVLLAVKLEKKMSFKILGLIPHKSQSDIRNLHCFVIYYTGLLVKFKSFTDNFIYNINVKITFFTPSNRNKLSTFVHINDIWDISWVLLLRFEVMSEPPFCFGLKTFKDVSWITDNFVF